MKFFPFAQKSQVFRHSQANKKTIFIFLVDLKPEQLIMSQRKFISPGHTQQGQENCSEQKSDRNWGQQRRLYSNIASLLWISEPLALQGNQASQAHSQQSKCPCINQVLIRYLYLPPFSQYLKHVTGSMKSKNQKTEGPNSPPNNQNSIPMKVQLQLIQRHQMMYVLARSISSAIVYEFNSRYVRLNHFMDEASGDVNSIQTWLNSLNRQTKTTQKNYIWEFSQDFQNKQKKFPLYVVIKGGSYSSQSQFQVCRIKLLPCGQDGQSKYQTSSNSLRMEIQSENVMKVNKRNNNDILSVDVTSQSDRDVRKAIKLLGMSCQEFVQFTSSSYKEQIPQKEHRQDVGQVYQNQGRLNPNHSKDHQHSLKPINFHHLYSLLSTKIFPLPGNHLRISSAQTSQTGKSPYIRPKSKNLSKKASMGNTFIIDENNQIIHRSSRSLTREILNSVLQQYIYFTQLLHQLKQLIITKSHSYKSQQQSAWKDNNKEALQEQMRLLNGSLDLIYEIYVNDNISDVINHNPPQPNRQLTFQLIQFAQCLVLNHKAHTSTHSQLLNQVYLSRNGNADLAISNLLCNQIKLKSHNFKLCNIITLLSNQTDSVIKSNELIQQVNITESDRLTEQVNKVNSFVQRNTTNQSVASLVSLTSQLNSFQKQSQSWLTDQLSYSQEQSLSKLVFHHLLDKMCAHNLPFGSELSVLFSNSLLIKQLKSTVAERNQTIRHESCKSKQLSLQLQQKQARIKQQNLKLLYHQKEQKFYEQVMKQLKQLQGQLQKQTKQKKCMAIDLQCQRIQVIKLKQMVQRQNLHEQRLNQQKRNFIQAISHLSKENQNFIALSAQRLTNVQQLGKKLERYKCIDLDITIIKRENQQLRQQNQSIKRWRGQVQSGHKQLLTKQIKKFNFVLKDNYKKFEQVLKQKQSIQKVVQQLHNQLNKKCKELTMLQQDIKYLKKKYFNQNYLQFDYQLLAENKQLPTKTNKPSQKSIPIQNSDNKQQKQITKCN